MFVGFNAVFDWMFVDDYFHRLLGHNPFGHTAIDIKSYALGILGGTWTQTSMRYLSPRFLGGRKLAHNALGDAQDQAELFRAIRSEKEKDMSDSDDIHLIAESAKRLGMTIDEADMACLAGGDERSRTRARRSWSISRRARSGIA